MRGTKGNLNDTWGFRCRIDRSETWGVAYPKDENLGRPLVSGADYNAVQFGGALGAECEAEGLYTFASVSSWTDDDQVITTPGIVDPNKSSQILWSGEPVQGPCRDMTQVAVIGGVSAVICGDGSIRSFPSGTAGWSPIGVENAVAVSWSGDRCIAELESSDCDGLGLVEFDDTSVESLGFGPDGVAGAPAIDLTGNTLWLWVEDKVLVSGDSGRSFN